ncbi:MAG: outer membrane lipoprotein carrier protein LolA [Myxococcota bacterium]
MEREQVVHQHSRTSASETRSQRPARWLGLARLGEGSGRSAPIRIAACTALLWISAAIAGAEPSKAACDPQLAEQTARKIQDRYEGIRDLRADFEQANVSATFQGEALSSPVPRRGKVVFAKPGRMRWTYAPPEASVVVSDGKTLWIHDIDAKTVTRLAVTEGYLSGAALQFLMGDGDLLASFSVTASTCDAKQVSLDLIPREDASYERLGLVADRKTGVVVATSVTDLFGNVTRIRFDRLEENRNPAPDTFVLKIPEGVEVIDYAESRPN